MITPGFFPPWGMLLVPIFFWLVSLYLILRFLRAFERGVRAHEPIADSLAKSSRGASSSSADQRTS